jgi:hypothetical protein
MTTLALATLPARAPMGADTPSAAGSHDLAGPLIIALILAALIGIAAISALFRSASAAISVVTQPTMAVFRMLLGALIVIVILVALLVSRPAEANHSPTPRPSTSTHR